MIGERQTVDVIVHPTIGECRCVYRNGPSFLVAADGTVTSLAWCGSGHSTEFGAYTIVRSHGGSKVKCKRLRSGDSHHRAWSAMLGEGWLVNLAEGDTSTRFDADDGRVVTFAWVRADVIGTEAYRALPTRKRNTTEHTEEDRRWLRYEARDGSAFVFRMGGAPPIATAPAATAPDAEQLGLLGVK